MSRFFVIVCLVLTCSTASATMVDSTSFYGFGKVKIYYTNKKPSHFVIFISGDGGWNTGVVDMAKAITSVDAMVVGIDITHYFAHLRKLNSACYYPAADFENLSKFIQKKYHLSKYINPVTAGELQVHLRGIAAAGVHLLPEVPDSIIVRVIRLAK